MRSKAWLAVGVLAAAVLSITLSFCIGPRIAVAVIAAAAWLHKMGFWGGLIFTATEFVVSLVGVVPGALLGIAAGVIYGVGFGFCLSASGILAGAGVAFLLGRSVFRPWIGDWLRQSGRLAMLDGMIAQDGWRLVALLRVSPIMPFSLTSYALGFSGISLRDYLIGTCASLPPLLGYVAIGAVGGMGVKARSQGGTDIHIMLLTLGAVATLALTLHLSRLLGRVLKAA